MKKYFVVVTVWSAEKNCQIKKIAGEFNDVACAELFKNAYKERYSADAKIVDDFTMLNPLIQGVEFEW